MRLKSLGWREDALCLERDLSEFVPETKAPRSTRNVCSECPVRAECLEFALSSPWEPYGIWAGMNRRELLPLWSERHRAGRNEPIERYLGIA